MTLTSCRYPVATCALLFFVFISICNGNDESFNLRGIRGDDPDVNADVVTLITRRGFPVEQHYAQTEDGYILGLFRIPYGRHHIPPKVPSGHFAAPYQKKVIFLQHGLLDSSYTWVNNFEDESLAFILADEGYDVWLGNSRGSTWSSRHAWLAPDSNEYWDFTWDDMARYDLLTQVQYVTNHTRASQIAYVGHSQGTTQAFAALSRPEYKYITQSIALYAALAPVAFVSHTQSNLLKMASDWHADQIYEMFGPKDFLPSASLLQICLKSPLSCDDVLFLLCGVSHHVNQTRLPVYVSQTPAGTSVKNIVHWGQAVRSDKFQMFDYGFWGNLKKYGQHSPPAYNLSDITTKTAIFWGGKDSLTAPADLNKLREAIPKAHLVHDQGIDDYNHLDLVWGVDAHRFIYQNLSVLLDKYLKTNAEVKLIPTLWEMPVSIE